MKKNILKWVGAVFLVVLIGCAIWYYTFGSQMFGTKVNTTDKDPVEGIACRVTIRYGHQGDVTTDYYVAESCDKCKELIEYTNKLPSDTPIYENNIGL